MKIARINAMRKTYHREDESYSQSFVHSAPQWGRHSCLPPRFTRRERVRDLIFNPALFAAPPPARCGAGNPAREAAIQPPHPSEARTSLGSVGAATPPTTKSTGHRKPMA